MVRFWKARKTGIDIYNGGDITLAAGAILDTTLGTLTAPGYAPATLAVSNANHFAVSADGIVTLNTGGNAAVFDAHGTPGTLSVACTNITLTGVVQLTGATTVTGAFKATTIGMAAASHLAIDADGVITLMSAGNIAHIDAHTAPGTLAIDCAAIHLTGATTNTGALTVSGLTTLDGGLTLGAGTAKVTWGAHANNFCVVATYNGDAANWAAGAAPAFVVAHPYIKVMCNSVQYRIPIFKDA